VFDADDSIKIGVVLERRRIDSPWQDHAWTAVGVIPGAADVDEWKTLQSGEDWIRFHAATLPLELFRKETEGYKVNLSQDPPHVFVVLRPGEDGDGPEMTPFHVSVCPYEVQDYMDSGEEQVDDVPMPDEILDWVQAFIDAHHVDEPFIKRKRKNFDPDRDGFAARERPRGPDER